MNYNRQTDITIVGIAALIGSALCTRRYTAYSCYWRSW